MFEPLMDHVYINRSEGQLYPHDGYAIVTMDGTIHVHPKRNADVEVWVYVLAHCLLHLGFEHFKKKPRQDLWNIACDVYIAKFLDDFKLGRNPYGLSYIIKDLHVNSAEQLYKYLFEHSVNKKLLGFGTGNPMAHDMLFVKQRNFPGYLKLDWSKLFSIGLRNSVTSAVNVAAGKQTNLASSKYNNSDAQRARSWFMNSYPLLGSLASNFEIIEDQELCRKMNISVAAVHAGMKEIYVNPASGLTEEEYKFVIAHELLHVGLRHDTRRQGRDPFFWNVACDYVINGWLVEMKLGNMPAIGSLYDNDLKGESAEAVYDIITTNLRRLRKLATYRGIGGCEMLDPQVSNWNSCQDSVNLDGFFRDCIMQGLEYHQNHNRGYLPAGLIEEVKALSQPAIPWDVELAQWFDGYFTPLEKIRSYAKPSHRQFGTPDIPCPRYIPICGSEESRTFGVLLDTSNSMNQSLLARGLGAIIAYSFSRDVSCIRLIFCDAATYDQGYIAPEELLERVEVKVRGGTSLQPGVDLLQNSEDFPKDAPILIITDGGCDQLSIKNKHAFLMPSYARLPFVPKGKLFRMY